MAVLDCFVGSRKSSARTEGRTVGSVSFLLKIFAKVTMEYLS